MQKIVLILLSAGMLASCSLMKNVSTGIEAAETAEQAGDYAKALQIWEQMIVSDEQNGTAATSKAYDRAGQAALKTADTLTAEKHFKMAVYHRTASAETWSFLSNYYQKQDNLSLEVMALEGLVKNFPDNPKTMEALPGLFSLYVETTQWEKANELWPKMKSVHEDPIYLSQWLAVNKALDNDEKCDQIADLLLKKEPANIAALEWNAIRYYKKGEERYQREMQAYEKNKTRSQYAKLLKQLELSTADFKKSLKFFESLYSQQNLKRHALYMANIYARFGDEKNAAKYQRLAE